MKASEPEQTWRNSLEMLLLPSAHQNVMKNNPFSVMESQERLAPVIGANIGGIPELINNCEDGFLFESGDPKWIVRLCIHEFSI